MTPWQAFIVGAVFGFVLLSFVVETKRRGMSAHAMQQVAPNLYFVFK